MTDTDRLAALLAEVTTRANAVVREQDAIDFIDWCRDDLPAAAGVTVAPDLLAAAQAVVKAWDAGSLVVTDFDHDTYAIEDIRRLRAAIEEADRG